MYYWSCNVVLVFFMVILGFYVLCCQNAEMFKWFSHLDHVNKPLLAILMKPFLMFGSIYLHCLHVCLCVCEYNSRLRREPCERCDLWRARQMTSVTWYKSTDTDTLRSSDLSSSSPHSACCGLSCSAAAFICTALWFLLKEYPEVSGLLHVCIHCQSKSNTFIYI